MAAKTQTIPAGAQSSQAKRAPMRVFGLEDVAALPVLPSAGKALARVAFTCFGEDSAEKSAILTDRVVTSLLSIRDRDRVGVVRIRLDEALGADGETFHHPFLSGDPVVCCMEGDEAIVDAIARGMASARRKMRLIAARPTSPLKSLRVQLVIIGDAIAVSAEGAFSAAVGTLREAGWRTFVVESSAFDAFYSGEEIA